MSQMIAIQFAVYLLLSLPTATLKIPMLAFVHPSRIWTTGAPLQHISGARVSVGQRAGGQEISQAEVMRTGAAGVRYETAIQVQVSDKQRAFWQFRVARLPATFSAHAVRSARPHTFFCTRVSMLTSVCFYYQWLNHCTQRLNQRQLLYLRTRRIVRSSW